MIKILIIITVLLLQAFYMQKLYADKELTDSLNLIEVINPKFKTILDTIVNSEKGCNYYSSKTSFTITVQDFDTICNILINASNTFAKSAIPLGCFSYGDNIFFIMGNVLNNEFFCKTNNFLKIHYSPNKEAVVETDDSYSVWSFWFYKGDFYLDGYSLCGSN